MVSVRHCLCALALLLVPSLALADDTAVSSVQHRIEETLVKPLTAKENDRGRFSRARMPPRERRVRVTQTTTTADASGREFFPFAIDVRFGGEWRENDLVGCAYPKTNTLFVKIGEAYRPAEFLLGKSVEPVPGVCVPGKARS